MSREQELKTALIRIISGIKKEDFNNCVFYDGILYDAIEEAIDLIIK